MLNELATLRMMACDLPSSLSEIDITPSLLSH